MTYRTTNQQLGTSILVDKLPEGVRVGVHDIGPVYNNIPAPKMIVEEVKRPRRVARTARLGTSPWRNAYGSER